MIICQLLATQITYLLILLLKLLFLFEYLHYLSLWLMQDASYLIMIRYLFVPKQQIISSDSILKLMKDRCIILFQLNIIKNLLFSLWLHQVPWHNHTLVLIQFEWLPFLYFTKNWTLVKCEAYQPKCNCHPSFISPRARINQSLLAWY
jgi:hypothetical protein